MENNLGKRVSASTVRNILHGAGFHGRVARKKFFVSERNRKKRLLFAERYKDKDSEFWRRVIFADESEYNIFGSDGRFLVCRKRTRSWIQKT